ncbi:hypothetical protein CFAM422_002166 [Trichoderma lentiforme]|uniref:Uncharacterized protein n=1 Tax=Trichoderma lentiforme TaxID=1567552 RepID=A0A9P5CHK3_9HYPO|nr:hypothetical protein CFAM422_002166 [Trichoderma lentiforme]
MDFDLDRQLASVPSPRAREGGSPGYGSGITESVVVLQPQIPFGIVEDARSRTLFVHAQLPRNHIFHSNPNHDIRK